MTTDRELNEVLAELGREHRKVAAPDSLERVLRAAAGSRKEQKSAPRLRIAWASAAIAALLLIAAAAGIIRHSRLSHGPQDRQAQIQSRPEPNALAHLTPPSPPVATRENGSQSSGQTRQVRTSSVRRREASQQKQTWNSLDEFVPLPVSEGLPVAAELSVVRMKLRGSDLQQYGLQTPPDAFARTMLAEFAVGEDGMPRAIRIVR